jgi:hypothetical protein
MVRHGNNEFINTDFFSLLGKIPKYLEALGWHKYMETKDWDEQLKYLTVEGDESMLDAVNSWFDTGNSKLKQVEHSHYSLMLQIGHENL